MAAVKSLPVHHQSAGSILFPLGSLSPSFFFFFFFLFTTNTNYAGARRRVQPRKLQCAYEMTQSNRVSDFVCSLFPKAILLPRGGHKKSPRALSKCRLYSISFGIIEPDVFFFFFYFYFFFNRLPIKPALEGVRSLENYSVHMKRLNQTESPIL